MLPYPLALMEELSLQSDSRILLVVLDGIGDLPQDGETPLAAALTPNLDELARDSSLGLSTAVLPGVTPGSGPGHLALFGYDPLVFDVARGVLSALGIGLDLGPDQVAARANFATLADDGTILDRRAGRISTELNERLIESLNTEIGDIEGVSVRLYTESEYRFVVVLEAQDLGGTVSESDPGRVGEKPLAMRSQSEAATDERTAAVLNSFVEHTAEVLGDLREARESDPQVNAVLLRGIGKKPSLPSMRNVFRLRPGSVAAYPMYRGVSRLVGMECLPIDLSGEGERTPNKLAAYKAHADEHDFLYFHVKQTDSYGEDGDFDGKKRQIELFDESLPALLDWRPEVVLITGDHSTPASLKAHSWHPLPVMIWSRWGRPDGRRFTEADCRGGSLGSLRHLDLMPLAMANAQKLRKYGA